MRLPAQLKVCCRRQINGPITYSSRPNSSRSSRLSPSSTASPGSRPPPGAIQKHSVASGKRIRRRRISLVGVRRMARIASRSIVTVASFVTLTFQPASCLPNSPGARPRERSERRVQRRVYGTHQTAPLRDATIHSRDSSANRDPGGPSTTRLRISSAHPAGVSTEVSTSRS